MYVNINLCVIKIYSTYIYNDIVTIKKQFITKLLTFEYFKLLYLSNDKSLFLRCYNVM